MSTMVIGPTVRVGGGARSAAGRGALPHRAHPHRAHPRGADSHGARPQGASGTGLHLTARGRTVVIALALVIAAVVFALGARSAVGAPSDVTVDRYVVQAGDTLWDIAAQSRSAGESVRAQVRELVRVNGLSGDQVMVGQVLVVPRG